jgi:hypothetical protein
MWFINHSNIFNNENIIMCNHCARLRPWPLTKFKPWTNLRVFTRLIIQTLVLLESSNRWHFRKIKRYIFVKMNQSLFYKVCFFLSIGKLNWCWMFWMNFHNVILYYENIWKSLKWN